MDNSQGHSRSFSKCPLVAELGNKSVKRDKTADEWIHVDKKRKKDVVFCNPCRCLEVNDPCTSKTPIGVCANCAIEADIRQNHQEEVERVFSIIKPYVPITVEELAATSNLDSWNNCNVRVIGRVRLWETPTGLGCSKGQHSFYLESVNEADGPHLVCVDLAHVKQQPMINELVQAFGEITIASSVHNNQFEPVVVVLFHRNMEIPSSDLTDYMKALEKMKKFVPLFIKRPPVDVLSSESDEDMDVDPEFRLYVKAFDETF